MLWEYLFKHGLFKCSVSLTTIDWLFGFSKKDKEKPLGEMRSYMSTVEHFQLFRFSVINNILYYMFMHLYAISIAMFISASYLLFPSIFLSLPWPQTSVFLYISLLLHIHPLPHIHPSTSQTPCKLVRIPIQPIFEAKIWCYVRGEWDITWKTPQIRTFYLWMCHTTYFEKHDRFWFKICSFFQL